MNKDVTPPENSEEFEGAPEDAPKTSKDSVGSSVVKSAAENFDPSKKNFGMDVGKVALGSTEAGRKVGDVVDKTKKTVEAAKVSVEATKATWSAIAPIVTNAGFWIAIAVVIVLVVLTTGILAATQTYGKNENAKGCIADSPTGSVPGVDASVGGDMQATANSIAGWLTSTSFNFLGGKPMTVEQAFGIIGNWSQESSLNPAIVQNGAAGPQASNAEIAAISGGGKAAGLAQWDGGRRTALANFATAQGGIWSDINIQLKYFQHELDGWEGSNLAGGGFNDPGKSVAELVVIFENKFERAGIPAMENRLAAAEQLRAGYNGGYTPQTGGSCLTDEGGANMEAVVNLAIQFSWPTRAQAVVGPGDSFGVNNVKPEYKAGKQKVLAEGLGPADGAPTLYASCDRFVATVMRLTIDQNIPWGDTGTQYQYLKSSSLWQEYTDQSQAQPGDIWITEAPGHVAIYVGDVNGVDSIAHASYMERVAHLAAANWINNFHDDIGRKYVGFRFIGAMPGGGDMSAHPPGENGRIADQYLCPIPWAPSQRVLCAAAPGLSQMNQAYRAQFGTDININEGYRDYAGQVAAKAQYGGGAATPGTSNHGWGKAIDFGGGINSFGTSQHNWMRNNAGKYGWFHPGWAQQGGSLPEAWHWEWSG